MVTTFDKPVGTEIKALNDKIGTVPTGKTVEGQITNLSTSTSMLIVTTATSTNTSVNTYNSRKFSDTRLLVFGLRDSNTTSNIRNTVIIPTSYWSSGRVVYVYANHGTNAENVSGVRFEYVSDTSVKIMTQGAGGLTGAEIVGLLKP